MSATEIVMDLQSAGATLPAWWGMRTGLCRGSVSLVGNVDFTAGPFTCHDYWQGGANGSMAMDPPPSNRVRIKGVFALPAGDPRITGILEGTEVYSLKARIDNRKTSGLGACAGCGTGVCIVLNFNQPIGSPGAKYVSSPANRAYATWQGGASGTATPPPPRRTSPGARSRRNIADARAEALTDRDHSLPRGGRCVVPRAVA